MVRKTIQTSKLAAAVIVALLVLNAGSRSAVAAGPSDMFANYYTTGPGVPAQLYVSPMPVPPNVGHTWITYQPLAPSEYLYKHKRTYYAYHWESGQTRTTVKHYHFGPPCLVGFMHPW